MTNETIRDYLSRQGVTRRGFLKYCATLTSLMALPPSMVGAVSEKLKQAPRPSVIWLSFQECTGCTESITRAHTPSLEHLIFDVISLDYQENLMAPAGEAAEEARKEAMKKHHGEYILVVEGSIPTNDGGIYSMVAGETSLHTLQEAAEGAAAIVAIGSCASFGGIPHADPNPTGAESVADIIKDKPIVNLPGCPPIPTAITGTLAHLMVFGGLPELDHLKRPKAFYGTSIHDRCYRRTFYDQGLFAETFDDEGARKGWCLFKLGCKGPVTYNACAVTKWNEGTSFPIESGHGCLGCSEPNFWDMGGFYNALSVPIMNIQKTVGVAILAGVAAGALVGVQNKRKKVEATQEHETVTVDDLEKGAEK